MIRLITIWILTGIIFAPGIATAQSRPHPYAPFEKTGIKRLFGNQVTVREGAGLSFIERGTLPIGTPVSILEPGLDWLKPYDYEDRWYRVKARTPEGTVVTGYIWGGFIADESFEADLDGDGEDELLLIQNRSWDNCRQATPEEWTSGLEIRIVKAGMVWTKGTIPEGIVSAIDMRPKVFPLTKGDVRGFYLSYDLEACESGRKNTFFFMRSGDLTPQYSWMESRSTDTLNCTAGPIYPDQSMGKENCIILYETCVSTRDSSRSFRTIYHCWDGDQFIREER